MGRLTWNEIDRLLRAYGAGELGDAFAGTPTADTLPAAVQEFNIEVRSAQVIVYLPVVNK